MIVLHIFHFFFGWFIWVFAIFLWPFLKYSPIPSKGKRILVTGAASGIGKATVLRLLNGGCTVYAADLRRQDLEKAFQGVVGVHLLPMDVTSQSDIEKAFQQVQRDGEGLYGIVNSAGIPFAGQLQNGTLIVKASPDLDIDRNVIPVFNVNTFGTMRVISTFFPLILESKGCIINISSLSGRMAIPTNSPYSASKFAINGYTSALRREVAPYGVRVCTIEPGFIDTNLTSFINDDNRKDDFSQTKLREVCEIAAKQISFIKRLGMLNADTVAIAICEQLFHPYTRSFVIVDSPTQYVFFTIWSSLPHIVQDYLGAMGLRHLERTTL